MKKYPILFWLIFITTVMKVSGQSQGEKLQSAWPGAEIILNSVWSVSPSLIWKWDTILCYNDQNVTLERLTQSFNANGDVLVQKVEKYQSGNWVDLMRTTYVNDIHGRPVTATTEQNQNGSWIYVVRVNVSYDLSGRIIMEFREKWLINDWISSDRRSYTYNEENYKLSMLQEKWVTGVWQNEMKTTYTYDLGSNNYIVLAEYSDEGGPWTYGSKMSYTCDMNDNWLEMLYEQWENSHWNIMGKIEYINDAQGNILSETFINWLGDTWVNDSRKNYTYDTNGNALSGINEKWQGGSWIPDMQTSYLYYKREYLCILNISVYRYDATYRSFTSGVDDLKKNRNFFSISPNPANDQISIDLGKNCLDRAEMTITDLTGKTIRKENLKMQHSRFDLSDLENGVYFVNIIMNNRLATEKLIIQK